MEENKEEEVTETTTEETSPEQETETEGSKPEVSEDIDHKKELEKLEGKPQRSELEKARNALFFNAKRFAELGGDPTEVLPKPKVEEKTDETNVRAVIEQTFAEKEARAKAKTDAEYNVIMWRVRNQGLSVEEAHLLANKGRYLKSESEAKRADVRTSPGGGAGQKINIDNVPTRSPEDKALLERRGLKYNVKTQTYQGKHTEEYWDGESWATRRRTS